MDTVRGKDSTGVFGVTAASHVDSLKGDADGYLFTETKQYDQFKTRMQDYKIAVGHNRAATSGKVNAQNAHPFREKHIIVVHNGSVKNAKDLAETEVDSHTLAFALSQYDAPTALGKIDGAYAVVWYDQQARTLNLARNHLRPLVLLEYPTMWIFASEGGLPMWLNGRENRKHDKAMVVPIDKILSFDLDMLSQGYKEVKYEEYKPKVYAPVKLVQNQVYEDSNHVWRTRQGGTGTDSSSLFPPRPSGLGADGATNLTAHAKKRDYPQLKAGELVQFELDDSQKADGCEVLLGHPVFSGEKDENVWVRVVLPKNDNPYRYFGVGDSPFAGVELWQGEIMHFREMQGIPTVFVRSAITPVDLIKDNQGEANTKSEVEKVLAEGCSKCHQPMVLADVDRGIVRKRADGSWRLICPACLTLSIKAADNAAKAKGMTLRARSH